VYNNLSKVTNTLLREASIQNGLFGISCGTLMFLHTMWIIERKKWFVEMPIV